MSVVPPQQPGGEDRSQGPWDRRSVADLSQTNFRTTMRGFDRDEVRAILESVAADYRVLQLQNASLQRQLADLEALLQSYRQSGNAQSSTALTISYTVQQANEEARAILVRAQAQADETMARVSALAREAERPLEKLEHDQRNFRVLLASTVSDMLAILKSTEQTPYDFDTPENAPSPLLLEAAVSQPPVMTDVDPAPSGEPETQTVKDDTGATTAHDTQETFAQPESTAPPAPAELKLVYEQDTESEEREQDSQTRTLVPLGFVPRGRHRRSLVAVDAVPEARNTSDPMHTILKELDKAMVEIPALPGE